MKKNYFLIGLFGLFSLFTLTGQQIDGDKPVSNSVNSTARPLQNNPGNKKEQISIFPNPVKDYLNIRSSVKIDNVVIFDILGKEVFQVNPEIIAPRIDVNNLPSGVYLVKITSGNESKTIKVIK